MIFNVRLTNHLDDLVTDAGPISFPFKAEWLVGNIEEEWGTTQSTRHNSDYHLVLKILSKVKISQYKYQQLILE